MKWLIKILILWSSLAWSANIDEVIIENLEFVIALEILEASPENDIASFANIDPIIKEEEKDVKRPKRSKQ